MPDGGQETELWLRRFHPAGSVQPRLVCFPHAGGAASFYHPLSAALAERADVRIVQYPGRQDRHTEPCLDSIAELADRLTPVLLPLFDRPVALFGHSMGAVVAFEVTRRLAAHEVAPSCLFASGRRAPSRRRAEQAHLLDDAGLLTEIAELGGTDLRALANVEVLRMVLPAIRADYRAIETYAAGPEAVVSCPITVLVGDQDSRTTLDEARAWQAHTTGEFAMRVFPGGHFYLTEQRDAVTQTLADGLWVRTGLAH